HAHRDGSPVVFGTESEPLASIWDANTHQPIEFVIQKESEVSFVGRAEVEGAVIERRMLFDPAKKSIFNEVKVQKTKSDPTRLLLVISEKKQAGSGSSFLMPSFEHQEFVAKHQGSLERFNVTGMKENFAKELPGISLAAVSSQYFATALHDQSDVIPVMQMSAPASESGVLFAGLRYDISSSVHLKWTQFSGPKSHNLLKSIDPAFVEIVNFGWFQSIGEVLLKVLLLFHKFLDNWGLSIIALTLLVRLLVLPFNLASYKSMKKMQKVQPLIQSIRERYKDDAQALNREMMQLFKEHKVNPVGGCLPMFLQMPVFFALYQVLGQSVELYRAPFFGWITDLSLKDPLYVLPVLMGLAMWFQQRITPSTMDPAQAKIMQFLPLVFCVFMLALPSGLTLYILVSTVFGIVQQQIFTRDQKAAN
ncbi:MAG: membrane protein insertase YidC, partial [Bdellovibrio sp.]